MGIEPLPSTRLQTLAGHYQMMIDWNQRANLTRITDASEAARLHYAECIMGARYIPAGATVLDIGSGAGFPAVPFAVARPDIFVTALEPNIKKSVFLDEVKDAFSISNLAVRHDRVEAVDFSGFDALTSRALDKADQVIPAVIERMRSGQVLVLFCTAELLEKINDRFGNAVEIESHVIPGSESRMIAVLDKK